MGRGVKDQARVALLSLLASRCPWIKYAKLLEWAGHERHIAIAPQRFPAMILLGLHYKRTYSTKSTCGGALITLQDPYKLQHDWHIQHTACKIIWSTALLSSSRAILSPVSGIFGCVD